jgi:hypothetical protein
MKAQIYKLEEEGWRRVGQGDWGIVLEKGEQVKKVTTDPQEIEHAEKLLGHSSPLHYTYFRFRKESQIS